MRQILAACVWEEIKIEADDLEKDLEALIQQRLCKNI